MRFAARWLRALSDARLERWFGSSLVEAAVFKTLAWRFDPRAAEGFEGSVVYELDRPATGGATSHHTVAIAGARATARKGGAPDAAVRLRMPVADFVRTAVGAIDPAEPVLRSRAQVKGDLAVAVRLPEMFRAPRPV